MARNWNNVKQELHERRLTDPARVAEAKREMEDSQRAYRLAQVRKAQSRTQEEIADAMGVSQVRVSKIERGDMAHTELGTLAAYVEAMGGRLLVAADFGGDRVMLNNGEDFSVSPFGKKVLTVEAQRSTPAKTAPAKKAPAKRAAAAKKTTAKSAVAKKTTAAKKATAAKKTTAARKSSAKTVARKAAPAKAAPRRRAQSGT